MERPDELVELEDRYESLTTETIPKIVNYLERSKPHYDQ